MLLDHRISPSASRFSAGVEDDRPDPLWMIHERRRQMFAESRKERLARLYAAWRQSLMRDAMPMTGTVLHQLFNPPGLDDEGLPDAALAGNHGLCGRIQDDLSPDLLYTAYRRGLLPRFFSGALAWQSPKVRRVVEPGHAPERQIVRVALEKGAYRVMLDRHFDSVLVQCARSQSALSRPVWLSASNMGLYTNLFDLGRAHCFEVFTPEGDRVAAGFGISVGNVFVLEVCYGQAEAIEAGLVILNRTLSKLKYRWHDVSALPVRLVPQSSLIERDRFIVALLSSAAHNTEKWTRYTPPKTQRHPRSKAA